MEFSAKRLLAALFGKPSMLNQKLNMEISFDVLPSELTLIAEKSKKRDELFGNSIQRLL